jgi:hypothetical protein
LITNTATGLIGEYIAASAILNLGFRVSLSQQDKVDLVAWSDDEPDLFLRIQVKSCDLTQRKDKRFQFNLGAGRFKKAPKASDHDIIALVSISDRRCAFFATSTINQTTKRFGQRYFESDDLEAESFNKALKIIKEMRK